MIDRFGFGSAFLPKRGEFLLRAENGDTQVVDRFDMSLQNEYKVKIESGEFPGYRYIPNNKET